MYENASIDGTSLADHTICFTFDDGPGETSGPGSGPRTLALAQYLNQEGVPATFFVVGKFALNLPHVMAQVKDLGHLIGNHSYDHPNLVEYAEAGGDVVDQISRTDGVIHNYVDAPAIMVRAPYGAWNANIAMQLNANLTVSLGHVGPIGWDVYAGDAYYWSNGKSAEDCAAAYLKLIERTRRGIVLLHDCTADREAIRRANRTLEVIQILIPALRERGYRFVRLDEVPAIAPRVQNAPRVFLQGANGLYVSAENGVNASVIRSREALEVVDLHVGKVALRTCEGQYLSPQNGGGSSVLASGPLVDDRVPLDLINLGNNRVAFRTVTGHFLSCEPDDSNLLKAETFLLTQSSIFTYEFAAALLPGLAAFDAVDIR